MEGASTTARIAAAYRARATTRTNPICQDRYAQHLILPEDNAALVANDLVAPEMEDGIAIRTVWLDDAVRAWAGSQLVLLGAGLDTRAARLARPGLRFFEVDHPDTQAFKCQRLAEHHDYPRDASTFVPCNFEEDDFAEKLVAAGFRPDRSSAFIWEGVIAYLTESAIRRTFRSLAALQAQRVWFDYLGKQKIGRDDDDVLASFAEERREPFIFTVDDIAPLVREEGFVEADVASMRMMHRRIIGTELANAPFFDRWYLAEARR